MEIETHRLSLYLSLKNLAEAAEGVLEVTLRGGPRQPPDKDSHLLLPSHLRKTPNGRRTGTKRERSGGKPLTLTLIRRKDEDLETLDGGDGALGFVYKNHGRY